uniref:Late transcription factor 1 n=1 Tax=Strongyloides stercoralis TaxID=6248 RepID=A0A0K0E8Z0_STRER
MTDKIINQRNLNNNSYKEKKLRPDDEKSNDGSSGELEVLSFSSIKSLENVESSAYKGVKYIVSSNVRFFCRIIRSLSCLSPTFFFIPMKDQLLICTHNTLTSSFSKIIFKKQFFVRINASCLVKKDSGCCISSEVAKSIFNVPIEVLEDIKHLIINIDPFADFINITFIGPDRVYESIKVNQMIITNPINDYPSYHSGSAFCIVSHFDLWKNLFRNSYISSEIIVYMKRELLIIELRMQNTGVILNFNIEINVKNLIWYNITQEFVISFSHNEFIKAYSIISKFTKTFVLEYVDGEVPLRMSVHQPTIVDFEIFLPCSIELNNNRYMM